MSTQVNITIASDELLKATLPLSSIVSGKQVVPMLNNFLFDITRTTLTLTASDLYTSVTTQIPVKSSSNVQIAVPGTILIETLRNIPEQPISITFNKSNYNIVLKTNNGSYQIACENYVDFPQVPKTENESSINQPSQLLKKAFKQTMFAVGKDEMFPHLGGVNVVINKQGIIFAATDGHRLVRYNVTRPVNGISQTTSITIPTRSLQMLMQLMQENNENVNLVLDEKHLFLFIDKQTIAISIIDETFPDYEAIIPNKHPYHAKIKTKNLQSAIKLIDCYASQTTHEIALHFEKNTVKIQAENIEFSNKGETRLPCTYKGSDIPIRLHGGLFSEMIKNISEENIELHLSSPEKAIVITPEEKKDNEDFVMLIMPIAGESGQ